MIASLAGMNWRIILLGVVVVGILGVFMFYKYGVKESFQSGEVPAFVMYYADWCPHCKAAKPAFSDLVNQSPLTVGSAKCSIRMISSDENPEVMKEKGIKGFPTFMLETADGENVEYQGPRTTDGWLAFLNEKLGGGI
jgi:thiol-disulfide isomerase/thioredoxin